MKILIKQTDWSGWNGGSSEEKQFEYDVKLKKEIVVKSKKYTTVKRFFFQKSSYVETVFSFKVLEIGDDYLKLQTKGTAGGEYDNNKEKYLPKISTIKFDEILKFKTHTMDAGSNFVVSIII